MTPELLDTNEAAKIMRVSNQTLRFWRHVGKGPQSFKMGERKVFYRWEDIEAWMKEQYAASNPA